MIAALKKQFNQNILIGKVLDTIDKYHLISPGDKVLVGVSGGSDSMCLLDVFIKISSRRGYIVEVAHVNHSLRGASSITDQEFVASYCKNNNINFHTRTFDVREFAKNKGIGIEEAARIIRYGYFKEIANGQNVKIAVAHHQQDQVETVLLNLIRGCGPDGMTGMEYIFGDIIRPLLDCKKNEIDEYIEFNKIDYCTDNTNQELCADRNRVRLELLPFLQKQFGRDVSSSILKTRTLCLNDSLFLEKESKRLYLSIVKNIGSKNTIPCDSLQKLDISMESRIIRHLFESVKGDKRNLSFIQTDSILLLVKKAVETSAVHLSDGLCACIYNKELHIVEQENWNSLLKEKIADNDKRKSLMIPLEIPTQKYENEINYLICSNFVENPQEVVYNTMARLFPYEIVNGSVWRYRREGDWIKPNSKSGSKTIKKLMIDNKIPSDKRNELVFLAKGSEILWIPELELPKETRGFHAGSDADKKKFVLINLEKIEKTINQVYRS